MKNLDIGEFPIFKAGKILERLSDISKALNHSIQIYFVIAAKKNEFETFSFVKFCWQFIL